MLNGITVEVHRHGRDNPHPGELDITRFVKSVQAGHSIDPAHGTCALMLALRLSEIYNFIAPGDWCVIRDARGYTFFFGHVVSVQEAVTVSEAGAVLTTPVQVQIESWLDMLDRVEVITLIGGEETVGTLFSLKDWGAITTSVTSQYQTGAIGDMLAKLFKAIARVRLPSTLGGGWLGDIVDVVYDEDSARAYAPEITVDPLPVAGGFPSQLSMVGVRSTVYGFLRSLFVSEPRLIELFPHLSHFEDPSQETRVTRQEEVIAAGVALVSTEVSEGDLSSTMSSVERNLRHQSPVVSYLRARPVLVYRVKPWREKPLFESTFATIDEDRRYMSSEVLASQSIDPTAVALPTRSLMSEMPADTTNLRQQLRDENEIRAQDTLKNVFTKTTWSSTNMVHLPSKLVRSIQTARTDASRLNCVYTSLSGDSGIEALEQAGLPVKISTEIKRHGLRSAAPTWSLTIPRDASSWVQFMRSICVQLLQFHHTDHMLSSGSVQAEYFLNLKDNRYPAVPLAIGMPFAINLDKAPSFSAYATKIVHSISVNQSATAASTMVVFDRGVYGYEMLDLRNAAVPIRTEAAPPSNLPVPVASSPNQVDSSSPAVACGRPVADGWPAGFVTGLVAPQWLQDWIIAAAVWDTGDTTGIANVQRQLREGFRGRYGPVEQQNLVAVTAAAFVIYRYWKQVHPGCRFIIAGVNGAKRNSTDTNHSVSAAFDFYIRKSDGSRVEAHRTWGALWKLASAKRIPSGGKGLYLNVNPETGWQATSNTNYSPGNASLGVGRWAGPGGSAGVHYDVRGAFGVRGPGGRGATSWLATDWTGDGGDELELGDFVEIRGAPGGGLRMTISYVLANIADYDGKLRNSPFAVYAPRVRDMFNGPRRNFDEETRRVVRGAITNYYSTVRGNDPTLPDVTPDVPNLFQVLGISDWCESATIGGNP